MVRQPRIGHIFGRLFLLSATILLLTQCQNGSGGAKGSGSDPFGGLGNGSGGNTAGTFDAGSEMKGLGDSLSKVDPENAQQETALGEAIDFAGDTGNLLDGLDKGDSLQELAQFYQKYEEQRIRAARIAALLQAAGLEQLARWFKEFNGKYLVARLFNRTRGWHIYTINKGENFALQAFQGYSFEGFAFKTAVNQRFVGVVNGQAVRATLPFNRCLNVNGAHFISIDANCEGFPKSGFLGWVAQVQTPQTPIQVFRFHFPTGGHITTSQPEFPSVTAAGGKLDGPQGWVFY